MEALLGMGLPISIDSVEFLLKVFLTATGTDQTEENLKKKDTIYIRVQLNLLLSFMKHVQIPQRGKT